MANLSLEKRNKMIDYLEFLKQEHSDDMSISAINEIENSLREKKYGLVWEEHSEYVDNRLKDSIPILTEDSERRICKNNNLPWNFLIEGDNLQALYLLEKTHKGKVDCIYIDPPYNTGARDWKYNNNYVDGNDLYRHSKWLSMMAQRLQIAKRLLNRDTGVLICTIDEHEVHHLRTLLEEIFPEAFIQMATIVINKKGVAQGRLARVEEYAIYVFMPGAFIPASADDLLSLDDAVKAQQHPRWERLLRGGTDSRREDSPTLFYPVYIDPETKRIIGVGDILPLTEMPNLDNVDDRTVAWPIRKDGSLGRWQVSPGKFMELVNKGYAKLGTWDKKRKTWTVLYLNRGSRKRIREGEIVIVGKDEITGAVQVEFAREESRLKNIKTVWFRKLHDSGVYGSTLLSDIIGRDVKFDFPKSLYSTKDAIKNVLRDKPQAIVVDFFAGSGTTLNAVNLMNTEDGGQRTCILVTNNECSEDDEKALIAQGFHPGEPEWEAKGICQAVTWPRTKYSIQGHRDDGTVLDGDYYTDVSVPAYAKRNIRQISFAPDYDSLTTALKKQLVQLVGQGTIPQSYVKKDSRYIVAEDSKYTATFLFDDTAAEEWLDVICELDHITNYYILTKNNRLFKELKDKINENMGMLETQVIQKRPRSLGFESNVKYFKCDWTERNPEEYLLSNVLCLHIKEMIELQNAIEIDNERYVLVLNKDDFKKTIMNEVLLPHIEEAWINQNIVFNHEELKALHAINYKYIPKEFFGQELKEAAE